MKSGILSSVLLIGLLCSSAVVCSDDNLQTRASSKRKMYTFDKLAGLKVQADKPTIIKAASGVGVAATLATIYYVYPSFYTKIWGGVTGASSWTWDGVKASGAWTKGTAKSGWNGFTGFLGFGKEDPKVEDKLEDKE